MSSEVQENEVLSFFLISPGAVHNHTADVSCTLSDSPVRRRLKKKNRAACLASSFKMIYFTSVTMCCHRCRFGEWLHDFNNSMIGL